jgi:uncharacterized protein YfaS (alpha-2-macroglobulin family)
MAHHNTRINRKTDCMNLARYKLPAAFLSIAIALLAVWGGVVFSQDKPTGADRARFQKLFEAGNFKDAYEGFRKLALDAGDDPQLVGSDLNQALSALQQLGRLDEIDELRESVAKVHTKNWRLLMAAADTYLNYEHFGFIIAGKFTRGPHRGGGEAVNSTERDRTRALQLMVDALPLVANESNKSDVANFWLSMSRMLLGNRGYNEAWRLQYLTDLSTLPAYDRGWYDGGETRGAPVDDAGNPVYYQEPKRWEAAETDGQRWRYALSQAIENDPSKKNEVRYQLAEFLQSQFGVQTMAYYNTFFNRLEDEAADSTAEKDPTAKKDESGIWALHTLGDDETIAKLANGIKRFKLPDEFNYIKIYQQIADDSKTGHGEDALQQLAQIYENRRQYKKAAAIWERSIKEYGPGNNNFKKQRLDQIVGNWGRFDSVMSQPADRGAAVDFQFRNGSKVSFEAHEVNVAKLLDDVKQYLKSNPRQLDWQKVNIGDVGYRLVQENQSQYVGKRVAQWDLDLKPRPDHFDRRITVSTPLQKAGAYLVTAKMAGGNTSKIVLWLEDTAIVKKPLGASGTFYFVADAMTGAPIAKANVEFFGYRQRATGNNRFTVDARNFAEATDDDGQIISQPKDKAEEYQWLITATTPGGRLAYLGFTGIWSGTYYDAEYNQTKVFTITDRPVYRPNQKVHFKFWVRHARYDSDEKSEFANQTFNIEIQNPRGEKVLTKAFTADAFGGLEGDYDLPADATLGVYQLFVVNYGGGSFRVEEYKKPEFEVTVDAPSEPVMLGEKIKATIQAKYYFGSPVTEAKVKYKISRTSYDARWYPLGRWDWLYGPGYWWFAPDYSWYPGWRSWGCVRPIFSWWPGFRSRTPPEIVAEREVPIGQDGKVEVEFDTAIAKLIHPDEDHQYTITAEVIDQSRRTIVGNGNVLVARKPFKVYAWVNRGFYKVGETIHADFQAQTLDQKPVAGKGIATLYQISYPAEQPNAGAKKEIKPVETAVRTWQIDPDDRGHAELKLEASAAGQYRLAYKVTDEKGHAIEGAYLFTIAGTDFDSSKFQFNDLELIPNEREYSPGQTANLMINANRTNGTVLLFLRPSNGVYLQPKILRLKSKSAVDEIAVVQKDMPNFFIEALTIAGGKLFTETREIVVPPERRVIDVEVTPSSETYKPGEKADVTLKLTDGSGKPFLGSTVVAIYDKAVEYISGGSNVQDIKAFFWKWRRTHYSQGETNLMRMFANLVPSSQQGMDDLGIFGGDTNGDDGIVARSGLDRFGGGGGGRTRALAKSSLIAPEAAAAPMAGAVLAADMSDKDAGAQQGTPLVEPTIRTNFADTALWAGALQTDENGFAKVSLTMPENLTTWKIRAWAMGHGTRVGQNDADVVTRKNLIVRLQAPRFFVEKDEVMLSANVHNYLKSAKQVTVSLDLPGKCLTALADTKQQIQIPEGGEVRVDWRVKVAEEGEAVIRMRALSDEESDAVEQHFPVYVHGMLKTESFTGSLRPEDALGKISLRVPNERRAEQTRLEVRYSPTLAGAMVDALPYMVDYPYGCTEQTLNRFLPTVITQRVLINMGLDLKKIEEKRTNLNAQQIGNDQQRAADWKQLDRNPVFDQAEVARMVKDGVRRLTEMQLSDGGWGWFSGWGEQSYPHTTAVVVHGMQIAKENDVALVPGVLDRGVAWLKNYQDRQVQLLQNALVKPKTKDPNKTAADNLDALVYMVLADAGVANDDMRGFLYRDRVGLAVYGKAMFALALAKQGGQKEQLDMLLENIHQFVVEDEENQTAYLKLPENNYWWCWYGSDTEANAYYLKLLAKTDPKGKLASRLVKYVLNNRQHGTYWKSTRDTALSIEALADYLKASGENQPDLTVEVWLDGKKQKEVKITAADLFTFDNKFVLEGDAISGGEHKLEIRKSGNGPLYYNAYLTNFTLEDYIRAAGLEVKVNRKFYKLTPVDKSIKVSGSRGQAVDQKVEKFERLELKDLSTLTSGDLVEVELEIDSKNDYEYLLFEDFKAAGFEPTEVRSGYTGNALGAYTEFRDNRVAFFIRSLPRGKHSVSYRLRAEIPGQFSALPAAAAAMYAPELKANSDEMKLRIAD